MQNWTGKIFSGHGGAVLVIALVLILIVYGRTVAWLAE